MLQLEYFKAKAKEFILAFGSPLSGMLIGMFGVLFGAITYYTSGGIQGVIPMIVGVATLQLATVQVLLDTKDEIKKLINAK